MRGESIPTLYRMHACFRRSTVETASPEVWGIVKCTTGAAVLPNDQARGYFLPEVPAQNKGFSSTATIDWSGHFMFLRIIPPSGQGGGVCL